MGDTVMDAPVPNSVPPPQLPAYHWNVAPSPAVPPLAVRVALLPLQIGALPLMVVGAVDSWFTVNDADTQVVVLQVPLRLTK